MWLHSCFIHTTTPLRSDSYTLATREESKHIVGSAHFKMHVLSHMCRTLSRAAKYLRQASFMPILICQSGLASYHFFPSAYFVSYCTALTSKPSCMNLLSQMTGGPLCFTGLLSTALYSLPWTKSLVWFHLGTGFMGRICRCRNIGSKGSSISVVKCKKNQVANYVNSSNISCSHAM